MVPEFIQDDATPEKLSQALLALMSDEQLAQQQTDTFMDIHLQLRQNASVKAAEAVLAEIGVDVRTVSADQGGAGNVAV